MALVALAVEEGKIKGPHLIADEELQNHLEVVQKCSTMSGKCCVARVVDQTVPITLGFILLSCLIHLHFPLYCLPIILIIKGFQRNSTSDFIIPLNVPLVGHPSTGLSSNGLVSLDKDKLLAVCECHEHVVADPRVTTFLSDLKKLLNYDGGPGLVVTHLSIIIQDFLIILSLDVLG